MDEPLTAGEKRASPDPRRPAERLPRSARKRAGRSRRGWVGRALGALFGLFSVALIAAGIGGFVMWQRLTADMPSVEGLRGYQPAVMSRVYAGDGRLLAELATERRIFVPFSAMPKRVTQAFVSAEDKDFWLHGGIDPLAIVRAGITDFSRVREGKRPLGASTITQQVAKNMLLDNRITVRRKVEEAILAIRMEQTLSKQRILEIYLNEIYLGQGAYGVEAAAQAYFDKPLDQLSVAQDAMLAALPKAPQNYNPFRHPEAAKARRDWVLDRMAEDQDITRSEASAAQAEPLWTAEFRGTPAIPGADWFSDEVRQQLVRQFGAQTVDEGGLTVRTSLSPTLQREAETSVRAGLMNYDRRMGGWRGPLARLPAGADLQRDWANGLGQTAAPPGMLSEWRLAVVLAVSPAAARVGWLGDPVAPGGRAPERFGVMQMGDEGWWHPMGRDGKQGTAFRRMSDMVQPGDVVMVQPVAGEARFGRFRSPDTLVLLRQVPVLEGALITLDPATGRVLAMVGGWSHAASQFNRATQAERQPGSSFKPIVYLTALEQGLSPSDRFLDAPIVLPDGRGGYWRPNNFERTFNGPTSLRVALEQSLNLVTVRVARRIGMDSVAATAEAFGMTDHLPKVLAAALGAADTTVMREAGAYASIATEGRKVVPTLIDSVQDREGHVVWRPAGIDCNCENPDAPPEIDDGRPQIADPDSAFQLITMMKGVVTHGTGVPAGKGLDRPIAGKTGTSQDFDDAWFAGFTPRLVTVVWTGFDTPASLGEDQTGAAVAAPIWHDFMAAALKDQPPLDFPQPPGVTMAAWSSGSGRVTDAFKPGQVPGASAGTDDQSVASGDATVANPPSASGVDTSLGGLY
jgi:penicillin-binding protein 1A